MAFDSDRFRNAFALLAVWPGSTRDGMRVAAYVLGTMREGGSRVIDPATVSARLGLPQRRVAVFLDRLADLGLLCALPGDIHAVDPLFWPWPEPMRPEPASVAPLRPTSQVEASA